MSYVSKCRHDIFISYSHLDERTWIGAFQNGLVQELQPRLGVNPNTWQDTKNIRIIKSPWEDNAHLEFFKEAQHLEFYSQDSDGIDRDLAPGTEAFRNKLEETAYRVAAILKAMRRMGEKVFVATPAADVQVAAEDLRNELSARGYVIHPEAPLDEFFSDKAIRAAIEPAELCVHLLGASYDKFAERQLNLSLEYGRSLFFWISKEAKETTDAYQKALVTRIRELKKSVALHEEASARLMIGEILNALKPKPAPQPATPSSERNVYIVCDPSSVDDCSFARFLQTQIQQREGFRVVLPDGRSVSNLSIDDIHQRRMRECDGILLYRNSAPLHWLLQQTPNVLFAEQILQRPPLLSRAFLLDDPSVIRDLPHVIPRPASFQIDDLGPFLEPLRRPGDLRAHN